MLSPQAVKELHNAWLPNISDQGLDRLIDLLEKDSPLLIQGSFTRVVPQGCLATHAAWHHPRTAHLTLEAGIAWLNHVAGLNPATSHVIREWDRCRPCNYEIRAAVLEAFKNERCSRQNDPVMVTPLCHSAELVEV